MESSGLGFFACLLMEGDEGWRNKKMTSVFVGGFLWLGFPLWRRRVWRIF